MLEYTCRNISHCIIWLGFLLHQASYLQAFQEMKWMSVFQHHLPLVVCEGSQTQELPWSLHQFLKGWTVRMWLRMYSS